MNGISESELLAEIERLSNQHTERQQGVFTMREFAEIAKVSRGTAREMVRKLLVAGSVESIGTIKVPTPLTGYISATPAFRIVPKGKKTKKER